jgi:hypothetical protein
MVPAGEGFGLPKTPAGDLMTPFDLAKRDALAANEDAMPERVAAGAANDLRSYLQRSVVLRSRALAEASRLSGPAPAARRNGSAAPTLTSLDDVLAQLRGEAGLAPRTVLVASARAEVDATGAAIRLARAQSREQGLCLLLDLASGPVTVGARLGLAHHPGLAELAAGGAGFDDVIQVDTESPLQVIAASKAAAAPSTKQVRERLTRILEAWAQVYDTLVLHADRETAFAYQPVLAGRLGAAIAVLGAGEAMHGSQAAAAFAPFGCAVLALEQSAERRRFLRRSA